MLKTESTKQHIMAVILLMLWLSMGLKESINSAFNILFIALAIFWGNRQNTWKQVKQQPIVFALGAWTLLYLIGLLYSDNIADAQRRLMIKSMFLILPIALIAAYPMIGQRRWKQILVIAPSLFALMCLIRASIRFLGEGTFQYDTAVFMYYRLSAWIMHPNYMMLIIGSGVIVLWWERINKKQIFTTAIDNTLWWFLLIFSGLFLQARTGFIILIALLIIAGVWRLRQELKRYWKSFIIYPVVALVLILSLPNEFGKRYLVDVSTEFVPDNNKDTSFSGRLVIWNMCMKCWRESLLLGHGPGDAVWRLHEVYEENEFHSGVKDKYNCHNQYLETAIALGIPGLIVIFLLPLTIFVYYRKRAAVLPLVVFVAMVYGSMCFESIFERHKGVMIVAVVGTALALFSKVDEEKA
ncbi:MAG: O-antigen ligase family protein [Cryomorphaceae bacterium]|nr:O-antigen ligase family protein [Cryomorphaceae bacterium]